MEGVMNCRIYNFPLAYLRHFFTCTWLSLLSNAAVAYANEVNRDFDIPAQNLSGALLEFSKQSGFDLLAGDILEDQLSLPLQGNYSIEDALRKLLNNDDMDFIVVGNSVLIKKKAEQITSNKVFTNALPVNEETEEIVVKGIRASIQHALDIKKSRNYLSEVITQEDVGKFPDANVVESLQRMTGSAITRTRGGEGQFISVRGLGQQFNLVMLDGRVLPTDNIGTEFSFDVLSSEIISESQIVKSPMASMEEGSIGAMINMLTPKPFNTSGSHFNISSGLQYDEQAHGWGNKTSMFGSSLFADGKVGLSVGLVYSDRQWRADMVQSLGYGFKNIDINNNYMEEENEKSLYMPLYTAYTYKSGDRQRLGVTSSIQIEFTPDFISTVDILYSIYKTPEFGTYQTNNFDQIFANNSSFKFKPGSFAIDEHGSVTHFIVDNYPVEVAIDPKDREVKTSLIGWKNKFKFSEKLTINSDISYSVASRPEAGKDKFWVVRINNAKAEYNSHVPIPEIKVSLSDGRSIDQARPDEMSLGYLQSRGDTIKDDIFAVKADASYLFDGDYVSTIDAGFSIQRRNKHKLSTNNDQTGGSTAYIDSTFSFADVGLTGTQLFPVNDFLKSYSGTFSRTWPNIDPDQVYKAAQAADGVLINPKTKLPYEVGYSENLTPQLNLLASNDVQELNVASFGQFNFQHNNWRGNIGLRISSTELSSEGWAREIISITPTPNSSNSDVKLTDSVHIADTNRYTTLLPSTNIAFDLSENLLLRASVANTISHPSLAQVGFDQNIESNSSLKRISHNGNPKLKPIKSTQSDLALEWYISKNSYMGADVFYKNIDGFVINSSHQEMVKGYLFEITQPENKRDIDFYGVEVSAQHFFDNGFGVQVNYSYANSTLANSLLENLSKESWNYIFIYEQNNFEFRLAANYRDNYLQSALGQGGRPETVDNYTQVDFRASYNYSADVQFFVDGVNILKAYRYVYGDYKNRLIEFEQFGRRYSLGARYSF
jgi:iron complex outermembrane receptor protein